MKKCTMKECIKKSWLARHPFLTNFLICIVFIATGAVLGVLINSFYFLLALLGLGLYIYGCFYIEKWRWVCSKCGEEQITKREKYCYWCGGEMYLKRKEVLLKYCENGHRIEDEYSLAKFCPKCGKPLE